MTADVNHRSPTDGGNDPRWGFVAVVGASLLFGTTGTAQELGPEATTPLGVGAVRLVLGAAVLVAGALAAGRMRPTLLRGGLGTILVGGVAVALYQVGFFAGTARSGVALGTVIALGSGPVAAGALQAVRTGRWPPRVWWWASGCAVGGMALLVAGRGGASLDLLGIGGSILAGVAYAVYATTVAELIVRGNDPIGAMAATFAAGAVLIAPALALEPLGWLSTGSGAVMALHLGVVTIAVAYALYAWGLATLPVATVVLITLAEPVTAALLGATVLDQAIGPAGWVGIAVVLVGLALIGRATPGAPRRGTRPSPRRCG